MGRVGTWVLAVVNVVALVGVAAWVGAGADDGRSVVVDDTGVGDVLAQPVLEGDDGLFETNLYIGSDFTVRDTAGGATIDYEVGGCVSSTGTLRLGLELPDDATVSSVTVYVDDTDAASDISVQPHYYDPAGTPPAQTDWYAAQQSSGSAGNQAIVFSSPLVPGDEVIDGVNRVYELLVFSTDADEELCGVEVRWLPEDATDLTFHPIEPCAAFDTRTGQGGREAPLAAGETVAFDMVRDDHAAQGGVTGTCGVPDETGGIGDDGEGTVAVMVNLVALNPASSGNLKLWDADDTEPNGGVLVFQAGASTNVVLPIGIEDDSGGTDGGNVNVKNNGGSTVDVRGVLVGYFTRPIVNQE